WRVIQPGRPSEPTPGHGKWSRSLRAALPSTPRSCCSAPAKALTVCETALVRDGLAASFFFAAAGAGAGASVDAGAEAGAVEVTGAATVAFFVGETMGCLHCRAHDQAGFVRNLDVVAGVSANR